MRYFVLLFSTFLILFSIGCSNNKTNNNQQPKTTTGQLTVISPEAPTKTSNKPPLDGKTAQQLYTHLKSKGWEFSQANPAAVAVFGSEESVGFHREDRVGFLIMRYDSLDAAQAQFGNIDRIYRNKFGRAVTAKNFIIAVFGGQKRINQPDFNQLSEEEYSKLQEHLVEFCNL
jgi:hypothetical protein